MFPCSHGKGAVAQADQFFNGLAMQLEKLEKGEPVEIFSDGTEDNQPGLRAGYYPGWENDIDLSVYEGEDLSNNIYSEEVPEWRKNSVGKSYGMVWVDVEINPSTGCGWGTNYANNCNFLNDLVGRLQQHGLNVGIYASEYMWSTVMGSLGACTSVAAKTSQYWYAHYDGVQSFSDYKKTGGWTKPAIKQFRGDVSACSIGIDQNFY